MQHLSRGYRASRIRAPLVGLALLGALVAVLWFARQPLAANAARWLNVGEAPCVVDYAMVLAGDYNTRPFVAAAFYEAHLASKVIVSHPKRSDQAGNRAVTQDINQLVLRQRGIPSGDIIVLSGDYRGTFDEAQALRSFLGELQPRSVAVVTSDYHTRRASWTFEHVFHGSPHQLHFLAAPTDYYDANNWWRVSDGLLAYSNEFIKLPFYWVRYGSGLLWIGLFIVVAWACIAVQKSCRRALAARHQEDAAPCTGGTTAPVHSKID